MSLIKKMPALSNEDSQRLGLIDQRIKHEGQYKFIEGTTLIDFTAATTSVHLTHIYYKKWRVIGIGVRFTVNFTAGENFDIRIGVSGDVDLFGYVYASITAPNLFKAGDVIIQDKMNMLGVSIFADTVYSETFTAGTPNGQVEWQYGYKEVEEYNEYARTSGAGYPFILVEIDRSESN